MVRKLIRDLRRKPPETREKVAMGAAGSVTGLVLVGWLVLSGPGLLDVEGIVDDEQESNGVFSSLFGEISSQAASLRDAIPRADDLAIPEEVDLSSTALEEIVETITATPRLRVAQRWQAARARLPLALY